MRKILTSMVLLALLVTACCAALAEIPDWVMEYAENIAERGAFDNWTVEEKAEHWAKRDEYEDRAEPFFIAPRQGDMPEAEALQIAEDALKDKLSVEDASFALFTVQRSLIYTSESEATWVFQFIPNDGVFGLDAYRVHVLTPSGTVEDCYVLYEGQTEEIAELAEQADAEQPSLPEGFTQDEAFALAAQAISQEQGITEKALSGYGYQIIDYMEPAVPGGIVVGVDALDELVKEYMGSFYVTIDPATKEIVKIEKAESNG